MKVKIYFIIKGYKFFSNISGTRASFNAKGDGSVMELRGVSIYSGQYSGFANARRATLQNDPLEECSVIDLSFNVESGGKIIIADLSNCSNDANLRHVVPRSHHSTKGTHCSSQGASRSHCQNNSTAHCWG